MNIETSSQISNMTNQKWYDRNIPSAFLQPYLDVRPVSTKYSIMPIVEPRKHIFVPMEQLPTYNPHQVFNPGNTQSPWSGYNVNVESELKNQIFALQKCSQSVYVPSSHSDLYHFGFQSNQHASIQQPFPNLFKKEKFNNFDPNPEKIGEGLFYNNTRNETREYEK